MPYKPKPINQIYFSCSEVAEMVGVLPSTIRFWKDQIGMKPKRSANWYYLYTEKHIKTFQKIKELEEKGYRLNYIVEHKLWK